MLSLINNGIETIKREGLESAWRKTKNRFQAWKIAKSLKSEDEKKRWEELKGKYLGKRAFLIGNGPSLNKTPLYVLNDEYKMCFNRFHIMLDRLNWVPNFFLTSDNLVLSDLVKEFDDIIPRTGISVFPGVHFRGDTYIDKIKKFENAYWTIHKMGKGFSDDLPNIYPGGSVIYEGFQILKFLGFSEVYLLGVDMNYKVHTTAKMLEKKGIDIISQDDDDPNHFDPRYFGKDRKYHQPEKFVIDNTIKDLDYIAKEVVDESFRIINVGYDSKLNSFPRQDFLNILGKDSLTIKSDFFKNLKYILYENQPQLRADEIVELESIGVDFPDISFKINEEEALKVLKKLVFTHIPVGPFQNQYYFILRKTKQ